MYKVPHKLRIFEHSDYDLDHALSPYEKKYNVFFEVKTEHILLWDSVSFNKEDRSFTELRRLVKLKHKRISEYNKLNLYVIKNGSPNIPAGTM